MTKVNPAIRQFTASDGYPIHYRHWVPECSRNAIKGHIVALHGIQSHSGWYEYSSQRLCETGFEVSFLDRRGAGLNEKDRGHVDHRERLINDVVQFINSTRRSKDDASDESQRSDRSPGGYGPLILLAVSWGAKIAAAVAIRYPHLIDQLVLLYPGLCPSVKPKWHQLKLLSVAMTTGKTRRMVRIPLDDPALFTSNSRWQKFIAEDTKSIHEVSVSFLQAGRELDAEIAENASNLTTPIWMALAGNDAIIDNQRTKELFDLFSGEQKTLHEYPDCQHTLEFEPNRQQVFDDLTQYLLNSDR